MATDPTRSIVSSKERRDVRRENYMGAVRKPINEHVRRRAQEKKQKKGKSKSFRHVMWVGFSVLHRVRTACTACDIKQTPEPPSRSIEIRCGARELTQRDQLWGNNAITVMVQRESRCTVGKNFNTVPVYRLKNKIFTVHCKSSAKHGQYSTVRDECRTFH